MKHLRSFLLGLTLFLAGGVAAAPIIGFGVPGGIAKGPQDVSNLFSYLNTLILALNNQITGYVTFNNTASETGKMAFTGGTVVSGSSVAVIMPNGDLRYIQTSATP